MDRRSFLKGIGLLGLGSILGLNNASAQQPPPGVTNMLLNNNGGGYIQQQELLKKQKKDIDVLLETNILPVIYAQKKSMNQISTLLYKTRDGFGLRQSEKEKEFEYNVNMGINSDKYERTQILEMHPYTFTLPGFSVDVTCVYSDPDVLNKNGVLTLNGTINSESFNMDFFYKKGRLTEASGNLGKKKITAAYEPAQGEGLEKLVQSGVVTIGTDKYIIELGIDVDSTSSYAGFSVSKI